MPKLKKKTVKKSVKSTTTKATKKKSTKKKTTITSPETRNVIYPKVSVQLCDSTDPITASVARDLLGWEEDGDTIKFGSEYLLKDYHGKKIRTFNNTVNRPFTRSNADLLKQEVLRLNWNMNGEPIIIGVTGQLINGQHSLVAIILASQEWEDQERWRDNWPEEPTMQKLIVFGISEEDKVVNTVDTGKPRSLSDVIYRSGYFDDMNDGNRRIASRIADQCLKMLWHRTGAKLDTFTPYRTHSESLDFISRHERILDAVKEIKIEDEDGKITQLFRNAGNASAFLYLMASSTSKDDSYFDARTHEYYRNQKSLNWDNWHKACEFWVLFAGGEEGFKPLRHALADLLEGDDGGSQEKRSALVAKAWVQFVANQPITEESIRLEYGPPDEDGKCTLVKCPTVGGIDLGNPTSSDPEPAPNPEELENRKATERDNRQNGA